MFGHPWVSSQPLNYVKIDAAAANNTLVAASSTKRIRVVAFSLTMTGAAETIQFQDGSGGTALTGAMTPTQGATINGPFCPVGLFQTSKNTLLNLALGSTNQVSGFLVYQLVPA